MTPGVRAGSSSAGPDSAVSRSSLVRLGGRANSSSSAADVPEIFGHLDRAGHPLGRWAMALDGGQGLVQTRARPRLTATACTSRLLPARLRTLSSNKRVLRDLLAASSAATAGRPRPCGFGTGLDGVIVLNRADRSRTYRSRRSSHHQR